MHKHILVAVDGSKMTERVLDRAVEEALLKESSLTILRVLETPDYLWHSHKLIAIMERTKVFLEEELVQIKKDLSKKIPEARIETFVENGNPKQKIIEFAMSRQPQSDLIVIGVTGESEESFAGSTATYVINFSHCDVFVVR